MMENILYIILAILGLSVLIFIHELGHYFMAKRVKMRIETFSIGFGKPIISWYRKGVKWQVGMLPFGGFVKIAGMQKEGNLEPHEIPDGFFGKKPWQRIKVAFMGPLVNIVFAFLVFSFIWSVGGRNKPFSEFTKKIGYVDPKSVLYDHNVRPGDEIVEYNKKKYTGSKDLLYASVLDYNRLEIKGYHINYYNGLKVPFEYILTTYPDILRGKGISTIGVQAPASYLIVNNDVKNTIMKDSGVQQNDRILWANGEIVLSDAHLRSLINESSVFLTIQRDNKIFHTKINLIKFTDLKLTTNLKNEIDDWRYFEKINTPLKKLNIIPYYFNGDGVIEKPLIYIDETSYKFPNNRNMYSFPLKKGDKIISVAGTRVSSASEILKNLQNPKVLVIVKRNPQTLKIIPYKDADQYFNSSLDIQNLEKLTVALGSSKERKAVGDLHLLSPFQPMSFEQLAENNPDIQKQYLAAEASLNKIKDPEEKEEAFTVFNARVKQKTLGVYLKDKLVKYNPSPVMVFVDVFKEIFRTFSALIAGSLSPKHLAGPIGIVQAVKISWSFGYLEALYWLGFISLNLGVFNLLPIPVLDGGHILFALYEMITRRPLKVKTMEGLIIPFVVLLVGAIIFITYHDILRIVKHFF